MTPDPTEFIRFNELLMTNAPPNYCPHFFVANKDQKIPHLARGSWSSTKNRKTAEQIVNLMYRGFNGGIAGMDDHLLIVDIDDENAIDPNSMVPTLSVRSRSRTGTHMFYYIDDIKDKINVAVQDVGELRSMHQYVIMSGSHVPTDPDTVPISQRAECGNYSIETAIPPAHINYYDLPFVFRKQVIAGYITSLKTKFEKMSRVFDPPIQHPTTTQHSALFDLEVSDVVNVLRDGRRFASPLHGSRSKQNTLYDGEWLVCFRCGCSHNAISCLAVLSGVDTCENAGYGHRNSVSGGTTVDMRNGKTAYTIWQYARENGLIPKDDTPPSSALTYFVSETGLCNPDEIEDGWRLPRHAYIEGIRLLKTNI